MGPIPQGRLPGVATPTEYRISLTVLPERPQFSGHVEIDVQFASAVRALWINGRDLRVTHVEALASSGRTAATYRQVDPLGVARLDFAGELPAGKATLVFDYDAPFSMAASALFHLQAGEDWYAWTQFESTDARGAFPGFDQPGYKTPFKVSLTTHVGQIATSNAPETWTQRVGSLEKHEFEPTRPLPTYLVQFGVGPFAVASGEVPPTPQRPQPLPLRIVATKPNAGKLRYALEETPRIVELLEQYFGQPFPFPKLDQIASPIMRGAMENAGADTYDDTLLLLDSSASIPQRQNFGMVVSHELSHQWFGDLVTPDWWSDIWLNESFANWMGYRIGDEWRPELNIGVGAIDEGFAAMNFDVLAAGRPIHQAITRTGEIESAFDSVTYGKGGQVIAMIAAYMGDERFREGVRLHLSRHRYGTATSDDFFAALSDAGHDPRILAALKSFVEQQGVPLIRISHGNGGTLAISQTRAALLGSNLPPTHWTIPVCLKLSGARSCRLLDRESMALDLNAGGGPIVPNADGVGYYRFSLDDPDWQTLIAAAPTLTADEALATSDSLWSAFRAGDLAPVRLIEAARSLASHPDSNASVDGGERLAGLRLRGMIPKASLSDYRRMILSIYGARLDELGSELRAGVYASDPSDRQKWRSALIKLVAEEGEEPRIRALLLDATKRYLGGDRSALDQSLLSTGLLVYVQAEGLASAKGLLAQLVDSQDQLFRIRVLNALGRSDRIDQTGWLLEVINGPTLRQTEKIDLLSAIIGQPRSRDMAYQFLKANFERLAKDAGIVSFGRLMDMPKTYCSMERAQEIEKTLGARERQYRSGSLELARSVELVRSCGLLLRAKGSDLVQALHGS